MSQSGLTAGQTYRKGATEVVGVAVDFRGKLRQGEVITGTPTAAASGPTIASVAANTAPIIVLGETCPAGTAVTFTVSGGTATTTYQILVTVTTSASQTRVLYCPLEVAAA